MPRIRSVKPSFFRHALLQDLEITYAGKCPMLVFSGLWGHCDKAGRFEWDPHQLKLDILPFIPFDMAETLGILESAELIVRFEVGGKEYGWIPTFTEHQRISGKEADAVAKYPEPPREVVVQRRGSNGEAPGTAGKGTGKGKGRGNRKGREEKHLGTRFERAPAIPEAWKAFCEKERADLNPEQTYERFADYWTAVPGRRGVKLDWPATWRNWVRNERRGFGPQKPTNPPPRDYGKTGRI